MTEGYIFTKTGEGVERPIKWTEINQLKKDILWVFDENGSQLQHSFIPENSFLLPYLEYMTLDGDKWFYEEDKKFYREGAIIIILCMVVEYIDIPGGDRAVFGHTRLLDIFNYVNNFKPIDKNQTSLKELLHLGLSIAMTITDDDFGKNEDYDHPDLERFYLKLPWVRNTFILPYYKSKLD